MYDSQLCQKTLRNANANDYAVCDFPNYSMFMCTYAALDINFQ